ncbi:hypothetical protein AWJ20_2419 [Sugiyamaella lignohabitans]|uniref:NmrA-like domain-containing protein n=1 Tax=Sugiyamaella lignohabitans TaxID=796027 RepID=A0A167F450_9ASCO|nr:uncharacterized protein AWJ20_2419 [Sugiyamaella lignohabitans]ANB14808.1 hypothetical protein AWJ20_2419 [Sugiyamaella lignohabitans]
MGETIVITGTSGNLGSAVLKHLLHTVKYPATDIIVASSNPDGVSSEVKGSGVKVRYGDYLKPETLVNAYEGADKLLIISFPSMAHEIRVTAHKNALDAAVKAGVKHVYYTSLAFNGNPTEAPVMFAHRDSEAYIKELHESGKLANYTIIREGIYSESFYLYFGYWNRATAIDDFLKVKEIVTCCKEGSIAYASIGDLGEATAKIITSPSSDAKFHNKLILLSGSRSVTQPELATIISSTLKLDKPIPLKTVDPETYVEYHSAHSDREILKKAAVISGAIDKGEASVVSKSLEEILGRPPKSIETTVQEVFQGKRGVRPVNEPIPSS